MRIATKLPFSPAAEAPRNPDQLREESLVCPGPLQDPLGIHPNFWKVFKEPEGSEPPHPAALRAPGLGP